MGQRFDGFEIDVSPWVEEKILKYHDVKVHEVEEAYANFSGVMVRPKNPEHDPPPTYRFIAETFSERELVVFVAPDYKRRILKVKTAFER
jgi:hypothetical protein